MKGWGYYFPKGRHHGRIFGRWNKKPVKINKRWDGKHLCSEQDCEDTLLFITAEIKNGTFDLSKWKKDPPVAFENAWRIYMEQSPCGLARTDARENIYEKFLLPYFKGKALPEISLIHIRDWYSKLPKGYAPGYIKQIFSVLKSFLRFNEIVFQNFPRITVPKTAIEWLTIDEQKKVLEFVSPPHLPIIGFIRATGCRSSEACNLRKVDIDWIKRTVTFKERKNAQDNSLKMTSEIENYLKAKAKVTHWEYVFCTQTGQKYSRAILYNIWRKANQKANEKHGVKVLPLKNGTRHSLASQLLNQGKSPADVARILGDAVNTVLKFYGSIQVERTEEILEAVEL